MTTLDFGPLEIGASNFEASRLKGAVALADEAGRARFTVAQA